MKKINNILNKMIKICNSKNYMKMKSLDLKLQNSKQIF